MKTSLACLLMSLLRTTLSFSFPRSLVDLLPEKVGQDSKGAVLSPSLQVSISNGSFSDVVILPLNRTANVRLGPKTRCLVVYAEVSSADEILTFVPFMRSLRVEQKVAAFVVTSSWRNVSNWARICNRPSLDFALLTPGHMLISTYYSANLNSP